VVAHPIRFRLWDSYPPTVSFAIPRTRNPFPGFFQGAHVQQNGRAPPWAPLALQPDGKATLAQSGYFFDNAVYRCGTWRYRQVMGGLQRADSQCPRPHGLALFFPPTADKLAAACPAMDRICLWGLSRPRGKPLAAPTAPTPEIEARARPFGALLTPHSFPGWVKKSLVFGRFAETPQQVRVGKSFPASPEQHRSVSAN